MIKSMVTRATLLNPLDGKAHGRHGAWDSFIVCFCVVWVDVRVFSAGRGVTNGSKGNKNGRVVMCRVDVFGRSCRPLSSGNGLLSKTWLSVRTVAGAMTNGRPRDGVACKHTNESRECRCLVLLRFDRKRTSSVLDGWLCGGG